MWVMGITRGFRGGYDVDLLSQKSFQVQRFGAYGWSKEALDVQRLQDLNFMSQQRKDDPEIETWTLDPEP